MPAESYAEPRGRTAWFSGRTTLCHPSPVGLYSYEGELFLEKPRELEINEFALSDA